MAATRVSPGHRLRSLDGWQRLACIGCIALFALLPIGAASRALAAGWQATGDVATIGLRSLDAWTPRAPLVGQPTTGQEQSGIPSNHPGPIENWLLGPSMRLLGPSVGLLGGVAAINGAALASIVWLAFRRGGPNLLAITAVMLALMVYAVGSTTVFDAFNSELPTYPLIAAAMAAWSVLVGDLRLTPLFVLFASIGAQPHVAAASLAAPMVLVVAISLIIQWRTTPGRVRRQASYLGIAAGVGVACWLPPLIQELQGPSNISALLRTQAADGPSLGLPFVVERLVTAVSPIPLFARTSGTYGFLAERGIVGVFAAALVIGGAGSLSLDQRFRLGRRGSSLLYLVVMATTLGAIVAWTGSPPIGAYRVDSFRWPWIVGFLIWLSLLWPAWQYVPGPVRARARTGAPAVALAVALVAGIWSTASVDPENLRDHRFREPVEALADQTLAKLEPGRYHLRFDGAESVITVGPAMALQLEAHGHPVSVEDDGFGRAYGTSRTGRRDGDKGTIVVANGTPELDSGDQVLATTTFPGGNGEPLTITVVLEP